MKLIVQGLLSTASRSKQQEVFTMPALHVKRVSSSQLCSSTAASPAFGSMPEMRGSTRTSITFEPTEVIGLHYMASALESQHEGLF